MDFRSRLFIRRGITLLIYLVFLGNVTSFSQSTVSVSGNSLDASGLKLEYTLGETVVSTLSEGAVILSQGMHQGLFEITSLEEITDVSISVFPNPTTENLTIKLDDLDIKNCYYTIYGMNGVKLIQESVVGKETEISLREYPASTYFLLINFNDHSINTYKIIKNSKK